MRIEVEVVFSGGYTISHKTFRRIKHGIISCDVSVSHHFDKSCDLLEYMDKLFFEYENPTENADGD